MKYINNAPMSTNLNTSLRTKQIVINGKKYTVREDGKVYGPSGKEIKQRPNQDGYAVFTAGVDTKRRVVSTHRLVAESFVENPNHCPEVDHLDSNRMNAASWNLEWVSHQENNRRTHERGHYNGRCIGEKNPRARVNEKTVLTLRREYADGITIRELHKKYNIPESTIGNIVHRCTWKHI